MKYLLTFIISIGIYATVVAQDEFHVFPIDHHSTPGSASGSGSIDSPWDLQTALGQTSDVVNSGDTIWLHEGVYNGRYLSTLESLESGRFITVSAFKNDKVILNGNVNSTKKAVLEVKGKKVIYKNLDITCLGDFSRNEKDNNYEFISGLEHTSGEDCQFINLKVYNIPGLGVGSWKNTGGSVFDGCMIFNNGFIAKDGNGSGEGLYTQNSSNKTRVIKNCFIFNNYYKGIEVWSANKNATDDYVKNFEILNNVIFNNGNPAKQFKDNLIIASGDRNGINIAKNIKVHSNIFYHNTDVENAEINGDAASLTLGFHKNSPVENVNVTNNIIIGRNNALRILHAKSLTFDGNRVYSGYVVLNASVLENIQNWKVNNNVYYTKKSSSFRIEGDKDYNLERWQTTFGLDKDSSWKNVKRFDMSSFVNIRKLDHRNHAYKVVLFKDNGNDVELDFSEFKLKSGTQYKMFDVENLNVVLKSGQITQDLSITFPMQLNAFEKPLHNTEAQKTLSNFGVYIIEFVEPSENQMSQENDNFFKRFFRWLGF